MKTNPETCDCVCPVCQATMTLTAKQIGDGKIVGCTNCESVFRLEAVKPAVHPPRLPVSISNPMEKVPEIRAQDPPSYSGQSVGARVARGIGVAVAMVFCIGIGSVMWLVVGAFTVWHLTVVAVLAIPVAMIALISWIHSSWKRNRH